MLPGFANHKLSIIHCLFFLDGGETQVNSEELELSLRTEFENYLKTVVAEMKQELADFQSTIDAEFEKHKSQINEAFQGFTTRFESAPPVDKGFNELVTEHLRLARDEGARLSATAYAEAEKMNEEQAPVAANYSELRDAISDISSKDSQSSILKSLVEHASKFAPRGAFFIIKNEHFAGWKVFGEESESADGAIRDIHFPTSADSILGKAASSAATAEAAYGTHSDDSEFLTPLQFGQPDRMYAIPLVARGRGVAVMYTDYGTAGVSVNLEALETIVRVAALTVELHAASQSAKAEDRQVAAADFETAQPDPAQAGEESKTGHSFTETEDEMAETPAIEEMASEFAFSDSVSYSGGFPVETPVTEPAVDEHSFAMTESVEETAEAAPAFVEEIQYFGVEEPVHTADEIAAEPAFEVEETASFEEDHGHVEHDHVTDHATEEHETLAEEQEPVVAKESAVERIPEFESRGASIFGAPEPVVAEKSPFERTVEPFEPAAAIGSGGVAHAVESTVEVAPVSVPQARLSDRPVDLPIEVPEEERRLHNDARRFARLLVSEIKLYNEKKVIEGRQSNDLYDRLREAIDRSREMYNKRVQPPVAARFDYFHYELLNALAEGSADRFGASYPGATI